MNVWVCIIVFAIYVFVLYLFFIYVSKWVFIPASVIGMAVVIWHYFRSFTAVSLGDEGWADNPVPPEPAYLQYFFLKAWKDYGLIVKGAFLPSQEALKESHEFILSHFFQSKAAFIAWAPGVVLYAACITCVVGAAALYFVLGVLHLTLLTLVAAAAMLIVLLCRLAEAGAMKWHRTFHACPHENCHERFDIALYFCPKCGSKHERLVPGRYGVFRRRCRCGELLNTFFLMGRGKLPAACPRCQRPITDLPIMRRIDIPLLGGPGSGKSSFLYAATSGLQQKGASDGLALTFTNDQIKKQFEEAKALIAQRQRLLKTVDLSPDAFQSVLSSAKGNKLLLSWFDPAGEAYTQSKDDRPQTYLAYLGAAIFLVDPFSIDRVRERYRVALSSLPPEAFTYCSESPENVFSHAMLNINALDPKRRAKPLAVVITKCDQFGIGSEILRTTPLSPANCDASATDCAGTIRTWLQEQDQGNLLRILEDRFSPVRYFCTHHAAEARAADDASSETGALAPLGWILTQTKSFDAGSFLN